MLWLLLFQDALTHFHAALEGDPNNYLTLYRRSTVYLAQGRARAALEDLNRLIDIKPDFIMARTQKAAILIKLGRLDEAHIELEKVVRASVHRIIVATTATSSFLKSPSIKTGNKTIRGGCFFSPHLTVTITKNK